MVQKFKNNPQKQTEGYEVLPQSRPFEQVDDRNVGAACVIVHE